MVLTSETDRTDLQTLTATIDAVVLLDLVCDLLFIRGHRHIRITDGPGDGARDIHSIDPTGNSFITQCKYHNNSEASVRSRETAELPIALIKLNCDKGLFVTTAKITPQSKREYLNDYPNLFLDFLDGLSLVRELRADELLHARWLSGNGLAWPYVVSMPVLIRRHEDDTPIIPALIYGKDILKILEARLHDVSPDTAKVSVAVSSTGEENFKRYREPQPMTQEEGLLPWLRCTEVKYTSLRSFASIESLQEEVARVFAAVLAPFEVRFTVIVGTPSLVPLSGALSASEIHPTDWNISIIKTKTTTCDEHDFFRFASDHWTSVTDARVTEADAIRLYNADLDVCVAVEHLSPVSRGQARTNRALRLHQLEAWMKSVFALLDFDPTSWTVAGVSPPDEMIEWPWGSKWLCGWYRHELLGGLISLPSGDPEVCKVVEFNEQTETSRLAKLTQSLEGLDGISILEPCKARHMLAAISYDPFQEEGDVLFRTAELTLGKDSGLPTPILPERRSFTVTAYFQTASMESVHYAIKKAAREFPQLTPRCVSCESAEDRRVDVSISFESLPDDSTSELLELLHGWLRHVLLILGEEGVDASMRTRAAWKDNTGITLGLSWSDSEQVYVSITSKDGVKNIRGIDQPLDQTWDTCQDKE